MSARQENRFERYSRQRLIPGWDQDKLDNARIAVVGGDWLAGYTSLIAAALGIGEVTIIDDSKKLNRFMHYRFEDEEADSKKLDEIISKVNPFVEVNALNASLVNEGSKYFLEGYDVVLDMTNSPKSKAISLEYSLEANVPCITASTMDNYGKLMVFNRDIENIHYFMPNFEGQNQDPVPSLAIAGIAVEEARKAIMGQEKLASAIYYSLLRNERFKPAPQERKALGSNCESAIIVGAGALGNGIALVLKDLGIKQAYIIDPDVIEETNLNRQVFYYHDVGEKKADALADKMKRMGIKAVPICEKFPLANNKKIAGAGIMFDCVDNFRTRVEINNYAVENRIPLVSGGTNYEAGQVVIYVPGKTPCIEHQLKLEESAEKANAQARQSCIATPNASVVTSNMIIAGLMAGEARVIASGETPLKGMLKYGSNLEKRVGFTPVNDLCECSKR